jgi:GTP cyclohydrolase I
MKQLNQTVQSGIIETLEPKLEPNGASDLQKMLQNEESPLTRSLMMQEAARTLLAMTREDPAREGLQKTPERFAKAFEYLLSGYEKTAAEVVGGGVFESEGTGLVLVGDVEFYSLCEHHLLPFWGKVTVAYFPRKKILGLSKIPRIIDLFARRVQVQERLTSQVLACIEEVIDPKAVYVKITARHLCMMMRGVEKQESETTTQALKGYDDLSEAEKVQLQRVLYQP